VKFLDSVVLFRGTQENSPVFLQFLLTFAASRFYAHRPFLSSASRRLGYGAYHVANQMMGHCPLDSTWGMEPSHSPTTSAFHRQAGHKGFQRLGNASAAPNPSGQPIRRRIAIPEQTAFTGSSMFGALAQSRGAAQNATHLLLSKSEGRSSVPRKVFDSTFPVVMSRVEIVVMLRTTETFTVSFEPK
jgi:hypothetical protein